MEPERPFSLIIIKVRKDSLYDLYDKPPFKVHL